jgi:aminoglycoside phosphotransferase (APT) family kinase protein
MGPEEAIELINADKHTAYSLDAQYSGGADQGAYRVIDPSAGRAVLKLSRNPMWKAQIERAKAATEHLRPLGYPVPQYLHIGSTDHGTYWLENEMAGDILALPNATHVQKLVDLVELQKGQVISEIQGQDWSWYTSNVVFRGESGNVRALMQYGADTSALAAQIEALALGLDNKLLGKSDLVHGDFNLGQVLVQGDVVTGVLDWDQAGYGDRTQDLVSLWYSLLHLPNLHGIVLQRMQQVSDAQTIKIFAAAKMLAIVAWNINKGGGHVADAVNQARTAIQILSVLT